MPTWVIYLLVGVAIVAAIGGGYLWLDHTLSAKDKEISDLREQVAADQIDIDRYRGAWQTAVLALQQARKGLQESQAQANRIKQADAEERQRISDFQRKVEGLKVQDNVNLDRINNYQACVEKDLNNPECGKLLQ